MTGSWVFDWAIWASLAIGVFVSGLVYVVGGVLRPLRLRKKKIDSEEDIPWEDLLSLMKTRYGGGKSITEEELSADQLMELLMGELPEANRAPTGMTWASGNDRRRSIRRWFNPIEVQLISPFHDKPVHGLIVNRSTGGLAILTDVAFDADTVLGVHPVDAPAGVGYIDVYVRHSRKASKLWVIGCQYKDEVAWNVKVWFG